MSGHGTAARAYLRRHHAGALATLSRRFRGYPFGSVVPFVLDHAARPVMLISRLAEHTRNIAANPHVSLLVSDASDDIQAGARLTLMGNATRLTRLLGPFRARYLRYLPHAARLMDFGDFDFYRIEPRALRFIAGFADVHWVSARDYAPPANALAGDEAKLVAQMNAGHQRALRDFCRFYHGFDVPRAVVVGVDCDGFDLRADGASRGAVLRVEFGQPVTTARAARAQLVALAKKAGAG